MYTDNSPNSFTFSWLAYGSAGLQWVYAFLKDDSGSRARTG